MRKSKKKYKGGRDETGGKKRGEVERCRERERERIIYRGWRRTKTAQNTQTRIAIMAVRVVQIRYRVEGAAARARDPLKGLAV